MSTEARPGDRSLTLGLGEIKTIRHPDGTTLIVRGVLPPTPGLRVDLEVDCGGDDKHRPPDGVCEHVRPLVADGNRHVHVRKPGGPAMPSGSDL